MSGRSRIWAAVVLAVVAAAASSCSSEEPQEFTADNRSGFLAACTDPLEDSRLVSSLCQCVFDETQTRLTFERFEQIEDTLVADQTTDLPRELVEIIAVCVIETAEL